MNKIDISVVIPCFRTGMLIPRLVDEILGSLAVIDGASVEIILVVDGSPDDTWTYVKEAANSSSQVRGINLMKNFGQHAALIAGVKAARGSVVVTMDDDFQHDPKDIPKLLEALTLDADVIYGVSPIEEHSLVRNTGSRAFKWITQNLLGITQAKNITAFRAFRKEVSLSFDAHRDPFAPLDVLLSWSTNNVQTIEIEMRKREIGESGYSTKALFSHALNSTLGFSIKPLRLVTFLGLGTFSVSLMLLIWTLINYVLGNITSPGYPSLVVMVSLFSGVQLLSIGILGEYLGRLHLRSMGQPRYVIRDET